MINIYFFGTGSGREKFEKVIDKKKVNIIGYIDNDPKKQKLKINGIEIIDPSKINKRGYDFLLITSQYYEEILNQLNGMGIYSNVLGIYEVYSLDDYLNVFSKFMTYEGIELIKLNYEYYRVINYDTSININETRFYTEENNLVMATYRNEKNYKIEYNISKECEMDLCVIYFSSVAVYHPNTESEFITKIIENDNYEWYNTRIKRAKKHIFVRDILKQWYINGINEEINSIDKLQQVLEKETINYNIICVGTSAGGYAAILLGLLLKAKYVLAFSPQFNLNSKACSYIREKNLKKSLYSDLPNLINKTSIPIFYFMPVKAPQDIEQYKFVKNCRNVKTYIFNSDNHGVPLGYSSLNRVLNLKYNELETLYKKFENEIIEPAKFLNNLNV